MPFTERYFGGILRIETTTRDEQELAAEKWNKGMRGLMLLGARPGARIVVSERDDIRNERIRSTFLCGRLIHEVHIIDSTPSSAEVRSTIEIISQ